MVQVRGFLLACPSPLPLGAAVLSTPVSCIQLSALLFFAAGGWWIQMDPDGSDNLWFRYRVWGLGPGIRQHQAEGPTRAAHKFERTLRSQTPTPQFPLPNSHSHSLPLTVRQWPFCAQACSQGACCYSETDVHVVVVPKPVPRAPAMPSLAANMGLI